jgi:hypothetical protein
MDVRKGRFSMKRPTTEALQVLSTADQATATQAGFEKGLFDQLGQGLSCAVRSLGALDENEQLTLLNEAEIAYQHAIYLAEQTGTLRGSPVAKSLQQLGTFLAGNQTLQKGN